MLSWFRRSVARKAREVNAFSIVVNQARCSELVVEPVVPRVSQEVAPAVGAGVAAADTVSGRALRDCQSTVVDTRDSPRPGVGWAREHSWWFQSDPVQRFPRTNRKF
jgi:hypothetical protein